MKNSISKAGILMLILMSGCSVYHPEAVSIEEGVASKNRIKVVTSDNHFFELKELRRENGQLYGIAGKNSDAAKLMFDNPQIFDGNNVKIAFKEDEIRIVQLKNRKMSNVVNVGVPLVGAAGLLSLTNGNFKPDVGY